MIKYTKYCYLLYSVKKSGMMHDSNLRFGNRFVEYGGYALFQDFREMFVKKVIL